MINRYINIKDRKWLNLTEARYQSMTIQTLSSKLHQ